MAVLPSPERLLVVLGTFANPRPDGIPIARGELLRPMRHPQLGRCPPIQEPHQVAAVGIAGDDHRAVLRALHHALVARQIEAALLVSLALRLMAADASALEDRE